MIALKRILVPTDFSESSAAALRYGVAFARAFSARLDLLHVTRLRDLEDILEGERVVHALTDDSPTDTPGDPYTLIHEAEHQRLAALFAERDQLEVDTHCVLRAEESGGPYEAIVRYAVAKSFGELAFPRDRRAIKSDPVVKEPHGILGLRKALLVKLLLFSEST